MNSWWFYYGVVLPIIVSGIGWGAMLLYERDLRRKFPDNQKPAE